jgi:hypothetical protein
MNMPLQPNQIRFRVDPADVPEEKAARRLHLTAGQFRQKLPELLKRGFPPADPTTGMYDLDAVDLWRRSRNARVSEFGGITALPRADAARSSARQDRRREGAEG